MEMNKQQLARELRQRLKACYPVLYVKHLTDDAIIKAYVTCSGCNKQWLAGQELDRAITEAVSVEDFLSLSKQHRESEHREY